MSFSRRYRLELSHSMLFLTHDRNDYKYDRPYTAVRDAEFLQVAKDQRKTQVSYHAPTPGFYSNLEDSLTPTKARDVHLAGSPGFLRMI